MNENIDIKLSSFEKSISRYLDSETKEEQENYIKKSFIIIKNKVINYNNVSRNINTLYNLIKHKFPEHNNFFVISEGHIIPLHTKLEDLFGNKSYFRYDIIERQKGGGLIDMFMSIIKIGQVFLLLGDFVLWIGKFLEWLVFFLGWLITDFLNPIKLFSDFQTSLQIFVISILKIPFELVIALFSTMINNLGDWMQGFWGWDQSNLNQNDKKSNYFKAINKKKGKKCYVTDGNTVPFSIILGTLICPPLGVFMDMGATGWLNIIICMLLTLMFYLPGLCYALLVIYS